MGRVTLAALVVLLLCAMVGPEGARAQAANPTFIGDAGRSQGPQADVVPRMAPASFNSRKREGLTGKPTKLKDFVEVVLPDGRKTDQLSPRDFKEYNKGQPDDKVLKAPPDNKLIVIDMVAWDKLSPAEKAASTIKRPVKRTRTYTVAKPIFQSRTYITYPCCCPETVQIQVGVAYETKTEVINETEVVGADFPTVEVNVPRDIVMVQTPDSNYDPAYSTQVPQYACSGSAKDTPVKPLVPLATDGRDNLVSSPGSTTQVNEGIATSTSSDERSVQLGSAVYDCGVFVACTPYGDAFKAGGTTTTTYNGTTIEKKPVAAKIPLGDLSKGLAPGELQRPGEDKGLNTFELDKTEVIPNAVLTNATGDPVGDQKQAPQMEPAKLK